MAVLLTSCVRNAPRIEEQPPAPASPPVAAVAPSAPAPSAPPVASDLPPPQDARPQASQSVLLPPTGLRFLVKADGIYALTPGILEQSGLSLPVATASLRLFDRAGEEPLLIEDGGDGQLDAGSADRIVFAGFYPRGTVTTRAILNDGAPYWLVGDPAAAQAEAARRGLDADPRRYEVVTGEQAAERFPAPRQQNIYNQRIRFEDDLGNNRWPGARDTETDFYVMKNLSTSENYEARLGKIYFGSQAFSPLNDDPTSLPIQLRVKLYGISRTTVPDGPDHLAIADMNGHPLGEIAWEGVTPFEWTTEIDPAFLLPGAENFLTLRTPEERSELVDQMAIDWFELRYPRYSYGRRAVIEWIPLEGIPGDSGQGLAMSSTGWLQEGVRLIDPLGGVLYEPFKATALGEPGAQQWRYDWRFAPPQGTLGEDPYNGSPRVAAFAPQAINANAIGDIHPWRHEEPLEAIRALPVPPMAIIIAHSSLLAEARRLASHRDATGTPTAVVDVNTLYDQYSEGLIAQSAITRFLADVLDDPTAGASLRYVTLFGDATFDYKGINEKQHPDRLIGSANLIPPIYFESGHYNRPVYPADHRYVADPTNAEKARAAIGRIPAANNEEARIYVDKVIAYEALAAIPPSERPQPKALLVSSWEESFSSLLNEAARKLDGFESTQLIADIEDYDKSVANFVDGLNNGCDVLYYVGHGGSFVWRVGPVDFKQQKDLFTPAHIFSLTNRGHFPIIFVSSCYTVSFDHARSLGESFIFAPDRGGIAVIGSPWKTSVHPNHQFNVTMMSWLYDARVRTAYEDIPHDAEVVRLGDAFLYAKRHGRLGGDAQIGFTLLGDPALRVLQAAPAPAAAPPEEVTAKQD